MSAVSERPQHVVVDDADTDDLYQVLFERDEEIDDYRRQNTLLIEALQGIVDSDGEGAVIIARAALGLAD